MTDVTLVVSDRDYPAHRLILCVSSDVFQVKESFIYVTVKTLKSIIVCNY